MVGNYPFGKGLSQFFWGRTGMTQLSSYVLTPQNSKWTWWNHCILWRWNNQNSAIESLKIPLLLQTIISLHVAKENNYKLRVSYPSPGFTPIANHLPLCGWVRNWFCRWRNIQLFENVIVRCESKHFIFFQNRKYTEVGIVLPTN